MSTLLNQEEKRKLKRLLLQLPNINDANVRKLLVLDLPPGLQRHISLGQDAMQDIAEIVNTADSNTWAQLADGSWSIVYVIESAIDMVQGAKLETQLQQLHEALQQRMSAPPPPPPPGRTTAHAPEIPTSQPLGDTVPEPGVAIHLQELLFTIKTRVNENILPLIQPIPPMDSDSSNSSISKPQRTTDPERGAATPPMQSADLAEPAALETANSRFYEWPSSNIEELAIVLQQWFNDNKYENQMIRDGAAIMIQGRKVGKLRSISGTSLLATIMLQGSGIGVNVWIGGGHWAKTKIAIGIIGLYTMGVLTATAAFGSWQQKQLENALWEQIEKHITAHSG